MNKFISMNVKAYITGYANKHMQEVEINKVNTFNVTNKDAKAKKRKYANLLIKNSKTPDELLQNTKKFCHAEINGLI